MRILHVITSLRTGGAEKLIIDLIPKLCLLGQEVDLLVFDYTPTPLMQKAKEKGIKIIGLSKDRSVYSLKNFFKLRPYLSKYDIIHTHNYAPQLFVAMLAPHKSVLITTEHGGSNRRRNIKWFKPIDKWMYRRYNKIICIADQTKTSLISYLKGNWPQITTINNGIDLPNFLNAGESSLFNDIPDDIVKVVMVAGFRWEKDQPTLIKAFNYLPENFHLFLIGDGVRKNEYLEIISQNKLTERVHLEGIRMDIAEILHSSDFVVMSSHFEGLSLSSIEGMASGRPFLASDVDGLREVVSNAGVLFEHENPKALAEEILKLYKDKQLYKKIAENCVERARLFDLTKTIEEYNNIYNSI